MTASRRVWWLAVLVALSPITVIFPAAADCPSPSIEVEPVTVAPGGLLEVRGDAFMQERNAPPSPVCLPGGVHRSEV